MTSAKIDISRIKVKQTKKRLEIRIPIKKNAMVLAMMILATLAWIFVLFVLVRVEISLQHFWYRFGLVLGIVGWFALGMAGASFFVWLFFGRERIILSKDFFITDKPLVFFYRRNFYAINSISNLRTDIEIYKANRNGTWIDEQRTVIKLDSNEKHVTIARGISKPEAEFILLQIAQSEYLKAEQFAIVHKL